MPIELSGRFGLDGFTAVTISVTVHSTTRPTSRPIKCTVTEYVTEKFDTAPPRLVSRVSPEVHRRAALAAELAGKSLNLWAEEVLDRAAG